ncbi:MAG: ribonuclease HII [Candidatus Heimdallarchaeota archaeon]|nr:ribonuclease HII [Candidatus Heimdallarchaeota archaeon]
MTNEVYIAGVDEAGRGPVIGPLVLCVYIIQKDKENKLKDLGVKDSKILSKNTREKIYSKIIEYANDYKTIHLSAADIDEMRKKATLNRIEQKMMVNTIKKSSIKPDQIYIDAADVNEERYGLEFKKEFPQAKIVSKHKADMLFPVVSAASIIAKVERDREISKLHNQYGIDFGSGYPSDPKTKSFLVDYYEEKKKFPPIVRESWITAKKIKEKYSKAKKLDGYFH